MKYVAILGVLAVVVAGFAYYALFSTPANQTATEAAKTQAELSVVQADSAQSMEPKSGVGTLESIVLLKEDLECEINYTPETGGEPVEGTYFVSDGEVRGDFLIDSPDLTGKVLSSMIMTDTEMFVWTEFGEQVYGVKVELGTLGDAPLETNEPVAMDVPVGYECRPWPNVDRTVFEPPRNVIFQDLTQLMNAGMEYGTVYEGAELPY